MSAQEEKADEMTIAFGPVPSRRLGRSLGINNIPPKICTYACVYCQLGRTLRMQVERQSFFEPGEVVNAVQVKLNRVRELGESVDYLTFVSDGEPTLDRSLGAEISRLKDLGVCVAVISNASLIGRADVRADLLKADWVSLKVDAVRRSTWCRINHPHGSLDLAKIMSGMLTFAEDFKGELATETMLVGGVNDSEAEIIEVAAFLGELQPDLAYVSIPTRPPAEDWVQAGNARGVHLAYNLIGERVDKVQLLLGYEGSEFSSTGDAEEDLLSITAVHPMRQDALRCFLEQSGVSWELVHELIRQGKLVELQHLGKRFYLRRIHTHKL